VDENLAGELEAANARCNLTIVIADPLSLATDRGKISAVFDQRFWDGSALLLPLDAPAGVWDATIQGEIGRAFPVLSRLAPPVFHAPIVTAGDLESRLDDTLSQLQAVVTKAGAASRDKTDSGPAQISATGVAA
jgi:hypothetical protein